MFTCAVCRGHKGLDEVEQTVDVVVRHSPPSAGRPAVDILAEAPGLRLFKTGKDVDGYIREERTAWNR